MSYQPEGRLQKERKVVVEIRDLSKPRDTDEDPYKPDRIVSLSFPGDEISQQTLGSIREQVERECEEIKGKHISFLHQTISSMAETKKFAIENIYYDEGLKLVQLGNEKLMHDIHVYLEYRENDQYFEVSNGSDSNKLLDSHLLNLIKTSPFQGEGKPRDPRSNESSSMDTSSDSNTSDSNKPSEEQEYGELSLDNWKNEGGRYIYYIDDMPVGSLEYASTMYHNDIAAENSMGRVATTNESTWELRVYRTPYGYIHLRYSPEMIDSIMQHQSENQPRKERIVEVEVLDRSKLRDANKDPYKPDNIISFPDENSFSLLMSTIRRKVEELREEVKGKYVSFSYPHQTLSPDPSDPSGPSSLEMIYCYKPIYDYLTLGIIQSIEETPIYRICLEYREDDPYQYFKTPNGINYDRLFSSYSMNFIKKQAFEDLKKLREPGFNKSASGSNEKHSYKEFSLANWKREGGMDNTLIYYDGNKPLGSLEFNPTMNHREIASKYSYQVDDDPTCQAAALDNSLLRTYFYLIPLGVLVLSLYPGKRMMDYDFGDKDKPDEVKERLSTVIGQLISGVHALHWIWTVHGNLKTKNVAVNENGGATILDFRSATKSFDHNKYKGDWDNCVAIIDELAKKYPGNEEIWISSNKSIRQEIAKEAEKFKEWVSDEEVDTDSQAA